MKSRFDSKRVKNSHVDLRATIATKGKFPPHSSCFGRKHQIRICHCVMGKEKRKTRLTKEQGTGEFVGFAAFAAPVAASASIPTNAPSLNLSPVYTGSDSSMSMLFPRIGQKRDATTKEKALRELRDYFADQSKPKKHQVDALSHFSYLTSTKNKKVLHRRCFERQDFGMFC